MIYGLSNIFLAPQTYQNGTLSHSNETTSTLLRKEEYSPALTLKHYKITMDDRVPPISITFEEEGTQTEENYDGSFYFDITTTPDTVLPSTNSESGVAGDLNRGRLEHMLGSSESLSSGSGNIIGDSITRNYIEDSSDSGGSIIDRLSKGVSCLLRPVSSLNGTRCTYA